MATLSYPGVYVEEVSSGVRPIETASTSTAAFVGLAEKGPDDEARRVTNWTEFQRYYGSFISDGYLAHSVFQFFNNGGRQCYIVRVTHSDAVTADVTVEEDCLARADAGRRDRQPVLDCPDPGRVDKDTIALAAIHDLGISRNDLHAGFIRRPAHRLGDTP